MSSPSERLNLTRAQGRVSAADRAQLLGQHGCVVWLTGLSGSGKSTLALDLERRLIRAGHLAFVLDGDNLRHGLCGDLAFSPEDRTENIRRAGEVAGLLADAGTIVLAAFISPYRADRQRVRETVGSERFLEVFVDAPLPLCEDRDPKGLYRRARAGEIPEFTGVSAPYEVPEAPEVHLSTEKLGVSAATQALEVELRRRGFLSPPEGPAS